MSVGSETAAEPGGAGRYAALLRDRNFLLAIGGGFPSLVGDCLTHLAFPWLVLVLTDDAAAVGLALAAISLPRAVLILVGGAAVDQYSPKSVLLATKLANAALVALLGILAFGGAATVEAIYAIGVGIGVCTAFSVPAARTIVTFIVPPERLMTANSVLVAMRQSSLVLGPLVASGIMWLYTRADKTPAAELRGLGMAFAVDSISFAFSAWTLSRVAMLPRPTAGAAPPAAIWPAMAEGLRYVWDDRPLRVLFLYWAVGAVLVIGPLQVALPLMAKLTFGSNGAQVFGLMMGMYGLGLLTAMLGTEFAREDLPRRLGVMIVTLDAVVGLVYIALGQSASAGTVVGLMFMIGVISGMTQAVTTVWLQLNIRKAMLGRTLGLTGFIVLGLAPLSAGVSGWIMQLATPPTSLACIGVLMLALSAVGAASEPVRRLAFGQPARAGPGGLP